MDEYPEIPVLIDFDYVVHETEEAVLFNIDDEGRWIPKSLIANLGSFEDDEYLELPVWFAEQEGLV